MRSSTLAWHRSDSRRTVNPPRPCLPSGPGKRDDASLTGGLRLLAWLRRRVTCLTVRLTEFWRRMREQFGNAYAESVAKDHVFADRKSTRLNSSHLGISYAVF